MLNPVCVGMVLEIRGRCLETWGDAVRHGRERKKGERLEKTIVLYATGSPGPPFSSIQRRRAIFHDTYTETVSLFVLFRAN